MEQARAGEAFSKGNLFRCRKRREVRDDREAKTCDTFFSLPFPVCLRPVFFAWCRRRGLLEIENPFRTLGSENGSP